MTGTTPTPPALPRRALLASGAVVATGGTLLAACGSSDAPPSAATGTTIVALRDVPVGGAVAAKLGGEGVIVAQPTPGSVVAFDAACTHAGCPVKPAGAELDCPCHGSRFNALTGAVLNGPATAPLTEVAVTVKGADVVSA